MQHIHRYLQVFISFSKPQYIPLKTQYAPQIVQTVQKPQFIQIFMCKNTSNYKILALNLYQESQLHPGHLGPNDNEVTCWSKLTFTEVSIKPMQLRETLSITENLIIFAKETFHPIYKQQQTKNIQHQYSKPSIQQFLTKQMNLTVTK